MSPPAPHPNPRATDSDRVLAARFAEGDDGAFDVLYERHRARTLAVCLAVLGNSDDAEDAMQETFTALAVALRDAPPRELAPWLTRVARNAAIDLARSRRRRALTAAGEVPDVAAPTADAGSADLVTVIGWIRRLPARQRTALLLRELCGHSYGEIARRLGTDENAIRGLIARARQRLRRHREAGGEQPR